VTVTTVSTRQKHQWRSSNMADYLQPCSSMLVLPHAKATPAAAPPAGIAHKFVHSSLPQARYLPDMRTLDVILESRFPSQLSRLRLQPPHLPQQQALAL
jgi:hypothetical protein